MISFYITPAVFYFRFLSLSLILFDQSRTMRTNTTRPLGALPWELCYAYPFLHFSSIRLSREVGKGLIFYLHIIILCCAFYR